MGCYQDALSNIMPVDWLDPYGRTPFAKDAELSVDITIVETQDGIRASSVKNPPRAGSSRLMDAIKGALGMVPFDKCMPCGTEEKKTVPQDEESDTKDKQPKPNRFDDTEPERKNRDRLSQSGGSRRQGSQPWSSGKSPEEPDATAQEKDAKEKAPKF